MTGQDDFHVDLQHANSQSVAALQYWASVVDRCDESVRIYLADEGGRDVFALGSVIIKSSHLHNPSNSQRIEIDYSYADANEIQAFAIAKNILKDVRVPEIYFAGKILMLSPPSFFIMISSLTYILDQWSSGPSPRKTPGCQFDCRVAVSIPRPKGSIQAVGTNDTSTATRRKAHRWTPGSLLCRRRSQHSQQRSYPCPRRRHPFLKRQHQPRHEFHAQ